MATALAVVSPIMTLFAGMQQASAQEKQGQRQQQIANQQAEQTRLVAERNALVVTQQAEHKATGLKAQGIQEQASAQRGFIEQRRQTRLQQSRAIAVAGASGGGVGDPTTLDVYGGIAQEGQFAAETALFEGDSAASLLNSQAALALYEGEQNSTNILYGGESQASLTEYGGAMSAYEGKVKASNTRTAAIASAATQGAKTLAGKYAPSGSQSRGGRTFGTPDQKIDSGDYFSAGARSDMDYAAGGGQGPYRY